MGDLSRFYGRPQSTNVEDLRSPFGSAAVDPSYSMDDRNYDFAVDALQNPAPMAGRPYPLSPVHLDELMMHLSPNPTGPSQFYGRPGSGNVEDRTGEYYQPSMIDQLLPHGLGALPSVLAELMRFGQPPTQLDYRVGGDFGPSVRDYVPPVPNLNLPETPTALRTGGITMAENYALGPDGQMVTTYVPQAEYASVATPADREAFAARKAAMRPSIQDLYAGIIPPSGGQ